MDEPNVSDLVGPQVQTPSIAPRRRRSPWKRLLLALILAPLLLEMILCVALYLAQDALILPTRALTPGQIEAIAVREPGLRRLSLTTPDGVTLQGWKMRGSVSQHGLILYFGGQGGEVSGCVVDTARHVGWTVIGYNYRGVGLSQGRPTEAWLFADALAIYDQATRAQRVPVVVMGTSLGSGVAVFLATQRPVSAVLLVAPYDSVISVAREQYPFLPAALLVRHRFDSLSRAAGIRAPLLALAGQRDTRIPPAHTQRLVSRWGGPATLHVVPGGGHDDLGDQPEFWPTVRDFLRQTSLQ